MLVEEEKNGSSRRLKNERRKFEVLVEDKERVQKRRGEWMRKKRVQWTCGRGNHVGL